MANQFPEDFSSPAQGEGADQDQTQQNTPEPRPSPFTRWIQLLASIGLGEVLIRIGTIVLFVVLLLVVVGLLRTFYQTPDSAARAEAVTPTPEVQAEVVATEVPIQPADLSIGIRREANIHTIIPDRPRQEITTYTVQAGDTIFGIGEKFGLKPQTILWGNYYTLRDDPHNLQPDQELNILPVDGTYYEWQPGDGLNGVARYFGVTPEDIINYPANKLDPATIGDFANPNIKTGTWLIVPGGVREFASWSAPVGVTRDNPAVARVLGAGSCGTISGGAVGFGAFIWPSNNHFLSGFDYSPATNHRGIDIAGKTGEAVYAADAGVIVYAGWNDYGYGNMIIVDHGNEWQTLYAHLSAINVVCGMSVGQGTVIGAIGSTGNSTGSHLHYEMMHSRYGKVNPWDFLP